MGDIFGLKFVLSYLHTSTTTYTTYTKCKKKVTFVTEFVILYKNPKMNYDI